MQFFSTTFKTKIFTRRCCPIERGTEKRTRVHTEKNSKPSVPQFERADKGLQNQKIIEISVVLFTELSTRTLETLFSSLYLSYLPDREVSRCTSLGPFFFPGAVTCESSSCIVRVCGGTKALKSSSDLNSPIPMYVYDYRPPTSIDIRRTRGSAARDIDGMQSGPGERKRPVIGWPLADQATIVVSARPILQLGLRLRRSC